MKGVTNRKMNNFWGDLYSYIQLKIKENQLVLKYFWSLKGTFHPKKGLINFTQLVIYGGSSQVKWRKELLI